MWTFVFNLLLHYDSWKTMSGSKKFMIVKKKFNK